MEITSLQIYRIDIQQELVDNINSSVFGVELDEYLKGLFNIVISGGSGRRFEFERESTEVRAQITRINSNEDFTDVTRNIADRLLNTEIEAQQLIDKLGIEIQKGILIQSIIYNGITKFIICKADYNEFIDDSSFTLKKGLPTKKKAFKAFVCDLNSENIINEILVFDTNQTDTKYWWNNFLELKKLITDEDNTLNAFEALDKGIFQKIKKDFPEDYQYLRNSAVRYFRSNEVFEMQDFLDNAIGNYDPVKENLSIVDLKNNIRELPNRIKKKFDNQFNIIREKVTAKFIRNYSLTPEIELRIKSDYPDGTIVSEEINGIKYVRIKSPEAYKYFPKPNQLSE